MRRHFIAGASCPECGAVDRIQRVQDDGRVWMECVACNMVRDLDAPPPAAHPPEPASSSGPVIWKSPKSS
ncbi:YheV family putative metal-binding protein [Isoalcanivorax beigongshangi]|uniref:YheV family putative metal-binding protein n=1 Tax=Isoalcanivorax beigongshangi TaxID=3238810 RepID=A0ABV4AEV0_9GAMM